MSVRRRSGRRNGRRWRLRDRGTADAAHTPSTPRPAPDGGSSTTIRDCLREPGPRGRPVVRVTGTLRSVSERSVAGMPALTAELDDGTASLAVIWLGRHAIAGIEPGRALAASGRVSMTRGRPVLFNPRYELQPGDRPGEEE
jgi:hypothetical protein